MRDFSRALRCRIPLAGRSCVLVTFVALGLTSISCKSRTFNNGAQVRQSGASEAIAPATEEERAKVELGLEYPFEAPERSYLFVDGDVFPYGRFGKDLIEDSTIKVDGEEIGVKEYLAKRGLKATPMSERTAILAYGANKDPRALRRKYNTKEGNAVYNIPPFPRAAVIPVVRSKIKDFEVVFGAHVEGYGGPPATIHHAPGAESVVFVNYLDPLELERMHATESVGTMYGAGRLNRIHLELESGAVITDGVRAYVDLYGALDFKGTTIAFERVPAAKRVSPTGDQPKVITYLSELMGEQPITVFDFALGNSRSKETRDKRNAVIQTHCFPFNYAHYSEEFPALPGAPTCKRKPQGAGAKSY